MATGIGQQLKGMMRKARDYWAELTDDESRRAQHRQDEQEEVHQRYGGVRAQGGQDSERAFRDRTENSQDRGPSDAVMSNPSARAGLGRPGQSTQLGSEPRGRQQMQDSQTQRQYTQQGGSGSQKTLSEQVGNQEGLGGMDEDRPSGSQTRSNRQQRG